MKFKSLVLFILSFSIIGLNSCQGQSINYSETFEIIWDTMNESYFDSTFGGIDWNSSYEKYNKQIKLVENDIEFYNVINEMLWQLNTSHTNLIRPGNLARYEPLVCSEGDPGLDIRIIDNSVVVKAIKKGSSADNLGLQTGYSIYTIDNIPVSEIIKEAEKITRPVHNNSSRIANITKEILSRLFGPPNTNVTVEYENERGERIERELLRAQRRGRDMGPIYLAVDFEAYALDNNIGYIYLNTLQPPLVPLIAEAIKTMGTVKGIILDLRGNSGGEIEGMPELFLSQKELLYKRRSRDRVTNMYFGPGEEAFKGPMVILIDQLSGSASELLAGAFQAIERAVIIGETSPGAVLESDMIVFPVGSIFMYPVAQLSLPNGTVLEGHGVVPDIEVGLSRDKLLKGIDSQIEAGSKYLNEVLSK